MPPTGISGVPLGSTAQQRLDDGRRGQLGREQLERRRRPPPAPRRPRSASCTPGSVDHAEARRSRRTTRASKFGATISCAAGRVRPRAPAARSAPCRRRPAPAASAGASSAMLSSGCGELSGTSIRRKPASTSASPIAAASAGRQAAQDRDQRQLAHRAPGDLSTACSWSSSVPRDAVQARPRRFGAERCALRCPALQGQRIALGRAPARRSRSTSPALPQRCGAIPRRSAGPRDSSPIAPATGARTGRARDAEGVVQQACRRCRARATPRRKAASSSGAVGVERAREDRVLAQQGVDLAGHEGARSP